MAVVTDGAVVTSAGTHEVSYGRAGHWSALDGPPVAAHVSGVGYHRLTASAVVFALSTKNMSKFVFIAFVLKYLAFESLYENCRYFITIYFLSEMFSLESLVCPQFPFPQSPSCYGNHYCCCVDVMISNIIIITTIISIYHNQSCSEFT